MPPSPLSLETNCRSQWHKYAISVELFRPSSRPSAMMMPGWLSDPHCPDTLELLEDPYRHAGYHPWPEVSPANLAFDFLGHIFPDGADPVSFLRPSSCGRSINADGTGVDEESSTNHNPR